MILNRDYYIDVYGESDLRFVSGFFDDFLVDCVKNYFFLIVYIIYVVLIVIGRVIRFFYLGVNGICDNLIGIFNCIFKLRNFKKDLNFICILWFSVNFFLGNGIWILNYFVLFMKEVSFVNNFYVFDIFDEVEFLLLFVLLKKLSILLFKVFSCNLFLDVGDNEDLFFINFDLVDF